MRMFLFWFAILSPKERLAFVGAFGILLYAICR